MRGRAGASLAYREFLLIVSLFLLLGTLIAGAAVCAYIFPPYMRAETVSDAKASALDWLALPAAAAGVCVLLAGIRQQRFGIRRAVLLAACAASVPAGAAALRLGDAYYACNYVPPAVFFAASAAAAIVARGLLPRAKTVKRRKTAAIICSFPAALLAIITAAASLSGHKLFATLAFLYLPIPFCAAAALAAVMIKQSRTAAAVMCVPLSVCVFCALRPYGFDFAFGLCAASSLFLPALAVSAAVAYHRKSKIIYIQEKNLMANQIIPGLGLHHIALKSADYEKSYEFYTKGLGMTPVAAWGEGDRRIQMFDIGDGAILELFAGGSDDADAGRYLHLALGCDDVDKAYARALEAGAKPKSEPRSVPLDSKPHPMTLRCAFVFGPSGEELEFFKVVQ